MSDIHIIHENDEWTAPLLAALDELGLPWQDWHLGEGSVSLDRAPPGVFYSRMSASSHTRGHRYAPELTAAVLAWLESHGAHVLNGSRALALELSKVAQYAALERLGIRVPRTVAAVGHAAIVDAARTFAVPFITKHNRAGKGLGVRLHASADALVAHLEGGGFEPSVDGITLVQDYVRPADGHITRVELIGGELLYGVRVDASGGFELCPADDCAPEDAFCPAGGGSGEKFAVIESFDHPLVERYRRLMKDHDVHVAAFEFIVDARGDAWTYDINTNTNYNPRAEARAGISGMRSLARYLGAELARHSTGRVMGGLRRAVG